MKALGKLAAFLTLILVLVTAYDVTLRYFFRAGSVAVQELEWHLFGAIILLGSAYTLSKDQHVRIDSLYAKLSKRAQAKIDFFGTLFFLLPFCFVVVYSSYSFVERSFRLMEQSADPGGLHYRFLAKALIPVGFILLFLQALSLLCKSAKVAFSSTLLEEEK